MTSTRQRRFAFSILVAVVCAAVATDSYTAEVSTRTPDPAALVLLANGEEAIRYPRNLTKADIERWMTELSNWGRWGAEDQAGTINTITPAHRVRAAALRRGVHRQRGRRIDSVGRW